MTPNLHLDRPLVTVFGGHDALDVALNDELDRRGLSTHTISTPMGWLASVTHAVLRLDTETGAQALQDLASSGLPAKQVVAVCEQPHDDTASSRVDDLCRRCGDHHEVSLIWHAPLELPFAETETGLMPQVRLDTDELALTIAEEFRQQEEHRMTPSFASQNFVPTR